MDTTATAQFLTFRLGGLEYGLDSARVRELCALHELERVAADGAIMSQVAVSRGVIMPLVDMRAAFGYQRAAADARADVVILQLAGGAVGMVVDSVGPVLRLARTDIDPVPPAAREAADYLLGVGRADGRRLILVDIDKLMAIRRKAAEGKRQAA